MPQDAPKKQETDASSGKVWFADEKSVSLFGPHLQSICRPAAPAWQQVKQNPSRTVYHGFIDGQEVYLKHFHGKSFGHRLGRLLGFSKARGELGNSQFLAVCGIAVPIPLAAQTCGDTEWILTKAVAPATPANRWHLQQLASGQAGMANIRQATLSLAEMVGRMHRSGMIHGDLHCGNILVQEDAGQIHLVLMDLHRAKRRRNLSRPARSANLAQLLHDRYEYTTRTDRLRFLKHYLQVSGAEGSLRGWQQTVDAFARRHRNRQFDRNDRRILRRNRYFSPIRLANGWRGHVMLASRHCPFTFQAASYEFTLSQWLDAIGDIEHLFDASKTLVIKDTASGLVVRRRIRIGDHELDVFIKRPRRKQAWKILLDCFRPSRPLRAFKLGHSLLIRHVATAMPLACIERRVGPFLRDSILITETVDGSRLNDFLDTWLGTSPKRDVALTVPQQRQLAQEVLWQMGRMLQRLHDNHFAHRDLKSTNMIVQWSPGRSPQIVLLDLDGLRHTLWISTKQQFQGLMRLNVSLLQCPVVNHAGRLRMLMGYLRRPGIGRINFKPYWRVLEEWSARKLRRQIRSRRQRQKADRRPSP